MEKFTVIKIEDAEKKNYVAVSVKYPTSEKVYTYIRKAYLDKEGNFHTVIEGIDIEFNNEDDGSYIFSSMSVKYETKGVKKSNSFIGSKKSIKEKIKEEIKSQNIEAPVPQIDSSAVVHHKEYDTIKTCIENNIPVYLAGPAGSGKNHTLEQISKDMNLEFYFTNSVQQEYKLTGFIDAGGTYHETEFYKAFKNGGLFFLDEMDASIPEVLVLLNAAIANGYFEFPNGRIEANENFRVVAAGNTVGQGADDNYTGRMVLDQATLDRFVIIEFNYDREIEMLLAKGNSELVDFIEDIRNISEINLIRATFSYRCITMIAKLEGKLDLEKILEIAVVKGLSKDTIQILANNAKYNKYSDALKKIAWHKNSGRLKNSFPEFNLRGEISEF